VEQEAKEVEEHAERTKKEKHFLEKTSNGKIYTRWKK